MQAWDKVGCWGSVVVRKIHMPLRVWAVQDTRCSGISSPTICCVLSRHVIVWVVQRISCLFLPICNYHPLPKLATALPHGHLALQHRSLNGISAVSLLNKSDYSEHRRACPHPQEEDLEVAGQCEGRLLSKSSIPYHRASGMTEDSRLWASPLARGHCLETGFCSVGL